MTHTQQKDETIPRSLSSKEVDVISSKIQEVATLLATIEQTDLHPSIKNLHQFLALEGQEFTTLDETLTLLGLNEFSSWRPHIAASLNKVGTHLANQTQDDLPTSFSGISVSDAYDLRNRRASKLCKHTADQHPLLLTLPSEAGDDPSFIDEAVASGVSMVRINTAHDDLATWKSMATFAKQAGKKHKRHVQVYVDLASWKMRTAPIQRVQQPVKISEKKQRTRILLSASPDASTCTVTADKTGGHQAIVAVTPEFLAHCRPGDKIKLKEARGKKRTLHVIDKTDETCLCELTKKTLVDTDSTFTLKHNKQRITAHPQRICPQPETIRVTTGERVVLSLHAEESKAATDESPVILAISDPCILQDIAVGERVVIDDGKVTMVVKKKKKGDLHCEVTATSKPLAKIKEEKGVNFPDSKLSFPALSDEDKSLLPELVSFADIIGISFVQTKEDIEELQKLLADYSKSELGIVAKIETKKAVKQLPGILEALIDHGHGGVMIARGDLAVEVGFEHLAQTQEYILKVCEAAHIPVIYATGICHTSMKKGQPTRSEIIDLVESMRTDCTMLNKGPFMKETVRMIATIYKQYQQVGVPAIGV